MCLQRKKVHGVLRGTVRSVSKRLAVHCCATPALPLQRVFPQTMRPKQDKKLHSGLRQSQATRLSARRPAQRPASHWGRHTATPDVLKTGHCKQKFTKFIVLPTQYDREKRFGASAKARRPKMFHSPKMPQRQRNGNGTGFQRVPVENPLNADVAPVADPFFQPLLAVVYRCWFNGRC